MNNPTRYFFRIAVAALLLCSTGPLFALQDVIGEIVYFDGDVKVIRDTDTLTGQVDFGFPVENFDQIQVGPGGIAEVALYPETGLSSSITIQSDSTLYFDITSLRQDQQGTVELLTGAVNLKVNKMAANSRLQVRTSSAVMGVRGTTFDVVTAVNGDILLATQEGLVACETRGGEIFFSEPGRVVQAEQGVWSEVPVAVSSLEQFQRDWNAQRIQALEANAGRAIQNFAGIYLDLREDFINAYVSIMQNRSIIQKWIQEDRAGTLGSTMDQMREKRQVVGSLLAMRRVLAQWERVYYRVVELRDYLQGNGGVVIRRGMSATQFYRQVQEEQELLAGRMQEVRYILKLYAKRNEGRSPVDVFENDGVSSEDDFFDDPESFF
ncbi:FecR family protein [Spirochaeta lutea]|nr:FecR family protein [Spirochaeta lutea]